MCMYMYTGVPAQARLKIYSYYSCVQVCVSLYVCMCMYMGGTCTGQKTVTDFLGAKVNGGCEPPDVVAGNWSQVL